MANFKGFIYAKTQEEFEAHLDAGEVNNNQIALIQDTNRLWTHGMYYQFSEQSFGEYTTDSDFSFGGFYYCQTVATFQSLLGTEIPYNGLTFIYDTPFLFTHGYFFRFDGWDTEEEEDETSIAGYYFTYSSSVSSWSDSVGLAAGEVELQLLKNSGTGDVLLFHTSGSTSVEGTYNAAWVQSLYARMYADLDIDAYANVTIYVSYTLSDGTTSSNYLEYYCQVSSDTYYGPLVECADGIYLTNLSVTWTININQI